MLVLVLAASLAVAPNEARPPARLHLADAPLALGLGAAWVALYAAGPAWTRTSCPCSAGQVNALDRGAVGNHWRWGERAANLTLVAALATAVGEGLLLADSWREGAEVVGLAAESALLAGAAGQAVKIAVARPYPYMYGPAPFPSQNADGINYQSFWSGHVAVPMAASVSVALLLGRGPRPLWQQALLWGAGPLLAVTAGALQVSAGNHFPTDVLAGAAAGAASGAANVWLHAE